MDRGTWMPFSKKGGWKVVNVYEYSLLRFDQNLNSPFLTEDAQTPLPIGVYSILLKPLEEPSLLLYSNSTRPGCCGPLDVQPRDALPA